MLLSNNKHVLSSIPQENLASDVDLDECQLPSQKALDVFWDPATDRMRVNVNRKERPCTRRGILSTISQTYDSLVFGLVLMYHEREGHMGCSQVLTAMYKHLVLNSQRQICG